MMYVKFAKIVMYKIENASVQVVEGESKKGNTYYRLIVVIQGSEFSMFLNSDQVTILRLMGYIS